MSEITTAGQPVPAGETVIPATETGVQETPATQQPSEPSAPSVPKGWQARIDQLTRQRHEAERRAAAAEAIAAQLSQQGGGASPQGADVEALAAQRAAQIVAEREYAAKTNNFLDHGNAEFKDFTQRCNVIASLGATERPEFMQIVTDMDDGHRVVALLADDPNETARILQLPAHKMALELAKIAAVPAKKTPVSSAPPPIKPVDGGGGASKGDPDNWSVADHIKHRQERESRR